ncbi:protein-L-isoaspartate O-methyltransferase [Haloarcula hispanica N601]|uniref:Protein-L-isoaspartate O-methyltransferase n=2 Tax=Haloarcula hispanica TaxID=51589 RepID=V5TQZ0_HALHI|nr:MULTISPECIES: protein-L-isoaspartate(D-aspartate) O-methyltransferase [Haloarcula]AEM58311.1 protein-L-isoaspartate O-methyltransferase [Haloarcula hispanica ATCC 33960]AHB67045.1 protein-L-isoaspartate O-methyltransferase [Haloarcula hispanica N601]AJF25341.1 protein-L-isoaspartate O-methyltransferase [Haloarcula sp. CBA1115]KAA9406037.1 protein-L-isoaspartate(D-aspartate) O-methyltransferase [Haloarcula sp. CBA1131]KZX47169.1 protein-L-isoaspartate O-methyltransferase [Haloarcula sp. K1]
MADWGRKRSRLADRLRERVSDEAVLAAIASVPRHRFVPDDKRHDAYADRPLPIGSGQTVSAPHMVAIMSELLDLSPGDQVLEVGTGCGYHAAVTAELVGPENVYSVEYHASLADEARETLEATGYGDVSVRADDGKEGWPDHAPYDRTYLTCAAPEFPAPLVDQTRTGGLLLAPIGDGRQRLIRAEKQADGTLDSEDHGGVRFVPLQ